MREDTLESDGGFDMSEYKRELDEILAQVVPADHPVHERL
jgi:hypothetical protein